MCIHIIVKTLIFKIYKSQDYYVFSNQQSMMINTKFLSIFSLLILLTFDQGQASVAGIDFGDESFKVCYLINL